MVMGIKGMEVITMETTMDTTGTKGIMVTMGIKGMGGTITSMDIIRDTMVTITVIITKAIMDNMEENMETTIMEANIMDINIMVIMAIIKGTMDTMGIIKKVTIPMATITNTIRTNIRSTTHFMIHIIKTGTMENMGNTGINTEIIMGRSIMEGIIMGDTMEIIMEIKDTITEASMEIITKATRVTMETMGVMVTINIMGNMAIMGIMANMVMEIMDTTVTKVTTGVTTGGMAEEVMDMDIIRKIRARVDGAMCLLLLLYFKNGIFSSILCVFTGRHYALHFSTLLLPLLGLWS